MRNDVVRSSAEFCSGPDIDRAVVADAERTDLRLYIHRPDRCEYPVGRKVARFDRIARALQLSAAIEFDSLRMLEDGGGGASVGRRDQIEQLISRFQQGRTSTRPYCPA